MLHTTAPSTRTASSRSFLTRALLCVFGLLFALQLIGAAAHQHELTDTLPDCAICHVAGHATADLPAAPPAILAVFLALAYVLARLPIRRFFAAPSYLIPSRQAPPCY